MPQNDSGAAPEKSGAAMTENPTGDPSTAPFYVGFRSAAGAIAAPPRLWHGLDPWSEHTPTEHGDRVAAHWARADASGLAIPTPFTYADMRGTDVQPDDRDQRKALVLVADYAADHDDAHWFWSLPFCPTCRGGTAPALRSLHRWLALHPGKTPPPPDLTTPGAPDQSESTPRSAYLTLDDLDDLAEPDWLVHGVIPVGGHGLIIGRDGTLKTFGALDMSLAAVTCRPWHGHETSFHGRGRVLFLAGEGVRSFGKRVAAWEAANRPLHPWERTNLVVRNGTVALDRPSDAFTELASFVREWKPDAIVFDTLQRSAGAADQNSASDMAVITERIAELRRLAGEHCTTIVVAHTTKADTDTRGSSSIEDDADFVLHFKRPDADHLRITVAKQKDGEDGQVISLHAVSVADSLALTDQPDPLRAIRWTSGSAEAKVIGALRGLAPLGPQSQAAIVRQVEPLAQSAVSTALARLVREGAVHRVGPPGRGATYALTETASSGTTDEAGDEP